MIPERFFDSACTCSKTKPPRSSSRNKPQKGSRITKHFCDSCAFLWLIPLRLLYEEFLDWIWINCFRRTDRRGLNVGVPTTRWCVFHFFVPVDSQRGIDRCDEIVDHR